MHVHVVHTRAKTDMSYGQESRQPLKAQDKFSYSWRVSLVFPALSLIAGGSLLVIASSRGLNSILQTRLLLLDLGFSYNIAICEPDP